MYLDRQIHHFQVVQIKYHLRKPQWQHQTSAFVTKCRGAGPSESNDGQNFTNPASDGQGRDSTKRQTVHEKILNDREVKKIPPRRSILNVKNLVEARKTC